MAQDLPHLPLPLTMNLPRMKRKGGGYKRAERDHHEFYNDTTKKIDKMKKSHNSNKEKYEKYFDPSLIFKIKLTQNVSDISFRDELRRVGIQTLSSISGKDGYHVVFTSDAHLAEFRQKLEAHIQKDKATFVDAIGGIEDIPREEKYGESLRTRPLQESGMEYVDMEMWRMEDKKLDKFVTGLENLIKDGGGKVTDHLRTQDFYVMRILLDHNLLNAIGGLREVAYVDRPAVISLRKQNKYKISEMDIKGPPPKDSPGILVVDSGILHHPLLKDSIADSIVLVKRGDRVVDDIDDTGHGTQVAGIALYGDISECCVDKSFDPRLWLYSAKVMYDDGGYPKFDEDSLLEHQFKDAVEQTISKHQNCRVINVSLGNLDHKMYGKQRQFRLASLIDEISFRNKDVMFTVAAGNTGNDVSADESYPEYMLEESHRVKIIDPATSAHALTVGASFQNPERITAVAWPSPITRVGPGLNGMIKPELIASGGGCTPDLLTINPGWVKDGRLFTLDSGTSFSSPKVAHYLGMLKREFPSESRNMLKALVLSSATIPQEKPPCLVNLAGGGNSEAQKIFNIYGYGVPDLNNAIISNLNRVLLKHDGKIPLDDVQLFAVMMPEQFFQERGQKSIEIVLVFDPPTNSNRADYLGVSMSFRLFKDMSLETIQKLRIKNENQDSKLLQKKSIVMVPGSPIRKKSIHQKAIKEWKRQPKVDTSKPLVLEVTCQKKWYDQSEYVQPYAVVMTIRHEKRIDIYNQIRVKNTMRVHVQSQT